MPHGYYKGTKHAFHSSSRCGCHPHQWQRRTPLFTQACRKGEGGCGIVREDEKDPEHAQPVLSRCSHCKDRRQARTWAETLCASTWLGLRWKGGVSCIFPVTREGSPSNSLRTRITPQQHSESAPSQLRIQRGVFVFVFIPCWRGRSF
jgi:hypothetical protein